MKTAHIGRSMGGLGNFTPREMCGEWGRINGKIYFHLSREEREKNNEKGREEKFPPWIIYSEGQVGLMQ